MSPGIRGGDAYMRKETRPWLLAKTIQRNLGKKAIHALNGIVFAGRTVPPVTEWSTEGSTSDCGTLSGKSRVQVVA